MSMEAIRCYSDIDARTREAWCSIVEGENLNPSVGPEWLAVAMGSIGAGENALSVFLDLSEDDQLSGVVPFFRNRKNIAGVGMSVLEMATNLVSYHAEIPSRGDLKALLERFLRDAEPWDVFQVNGLTDSGPTAEAIRDIAREHDFALQVIPGEVSPYLPIEGTWGSLMASKNKKFRYKVRRRKELVEKDARCKLAWYGTGSDIDTFLADLLDVDSRSWKARAGIDIPSRTHELNYHRILIPFLAKRGMLLGNVLYVGERPVAYSLCCHHRDWIGQLKTSFDEQFADLSPGGVVIDASIERAFALRAREFDFLGDMDSHKLAWTSHTRSHDSYFLFGRRPKARLVGLLKKVGQLARSVGARSGQ